MSFLRSILLCTSLISSSLAASGPLDPAFGTNGKLRTDFAGGSDRAQAITMQSDGKFIVVGGAFSGVNRDFALARYHSDGTPDTTFGNGGKVLTDFGNGDDIAYAVAVQANGKIVVAGAAFTGLGDDSAVARYNSDGSLDVTFNGTGKATTDVGGDSFNDYALSVVVQSDGKIVISGSGGLARYKSDGSLDTGFGADQTGFVDSSGYQVLLDGNGKIVVVGAYGQPYAAKRYNSDGTPDLSFNGTGMATAAIASGQEYNFSGAVQSDGKIVVVGNTAAGDPSGKGGSFGVVRYNTDGTLDTSFNHTGKAFKLVASGTPPGDLLAFCVLGAGGKIIIGGSADEGPENSKYIVARFNGDGTLDTGFNGSGVARAAFDGFLHAVALQEDGGILATGGSGNFTDFTTVRFLSSGSGGTDGAGNNGIDKTKPTVAINAPARADIANPFTLAGTVKETGGLASVAVSVNRGAPVTATFSSSSGTAIPWSVSGLTLENGTNLVEVVATDANGNVGTAKKTVTYVNDRPELAGTFSGRLAPVGAAGMGTVGLVTVKVTASGLFTGKVQIGGVSKAIIGILSNAGTARFKPALAESFEVLDHGQNLGTIAFSVDAATGLNGTLSGAGGAELAEFSGLAAGYSAKAPVPVALLNQPVANPSKGTYTVVFAHQAQTPPMSTATYPQGDGYASLTLTKAGVITLAGVLADGTKYTASGALRTDGTASFFTLLYAKKGGFGGDLTFDPTAADTDVSSPDFLWVRPDQSSAKKPPKAYASGWPAGIRVEALGTFYAKPASLNFGQGPIDLAAGNATLTFSGGTLDANLTRLVNIDPATGKVGVLSIAPATKADTKLTLNPATGIFIGTFPHRDGSKSKFGGILLDKGANRAGFGCFLSTGIPGQAGAVTLKANGP